MLYFTLLWLFSTSHYQGFTSWHRVHSMPLLSYILLESTSLYQGTTSFYHVSTSLYQGSTSHYALDSASFYHSFTSLYHGYTSLYFTLPWLYFTLLQSSSFYHSFTSLYFTLPWLYFTLLDILPRRHSTMLLLDSISFYSGCTSVCHIFGLFPFPFPCFPVAPPDSTFPDVSPN